jgi:integrase
VTARRKRGEGSITKRDDGRYQVRIDLGRDELGRRRRRYRYADTPDEAVVLLQRMQREKRRLRQATGSGDLPRTFGMWLDTWLEMVKANREPLTYRRYESVVRVHVRPALGRLGWDALTPLAIQRFLDAKRRAGLSANSVRAIWTVVTAALTKAERLGGPANIASSRVIDVPPAESAAENILTLAEARAFLASIRDDRLYALYLMAVVLGQRESSLLGLRWEDITEDYARVRLPMRLIRFEGAWQLRPVRLSRTKRAPKSLPLPAPVAAALREHRERQEREREIAGSDWTVMEHDRRAVELVFTTPLGAPLYGQYVAWRFQQRLAEGGLEKRRFHDLRHSAASVMLALKIPLKVVSEVLAHAGIQITSDLYGHLEDDFLREQLAILDAAWGDQGVAG